ncbi:hypothetical protein [Novosphingobium sp.]|uniref:hypothetical protein n=1 Tax=Novosphingobium sp. TaxID=1874826 RepID=UPI002B841FF3|nr:hypothetical protein [Novosphingobium sp.]HQV02232.1 hypothetical protein [Novosphingobium sp.]
MAEDLAQTQFGMTASYLMLASLQGSFGTKTQFFGAQAQSIVPIDLHDQGWEISPERHPVRLSKVRLILR